NGNYKYVGRLIVGFDAAGEIIAVNPVSGPVRVSGNPADADSVAPNADVFNNAVLPVANHVAGLASNVIATTTVPLDGIRNNIRTRETNQGNLGADALLYTASVFAMNNSLPLPDVALQNSGGIRNESVIGAGSSPSAPANITELNTFQINAFSNFVAIVPNISRAQFKEILENSVSAIPSANGRFAQISGFQMVYETAGRTAQVLNSANAVTTPGTRVRDVVLNDGTVLVRNGAVVPGPAITIATIDFSANGGDQYPLRGAPFVRTTTNYQIALEQYITQWLGGRVTGEAYPAGGEGRIIRR
ncbi:MAG: 5'-nucleotidase C-terminal domain-containing protein, partial [Planctomyces sp.]